MREIKFRVWHRGEQKMYYRGYQKISHVLLCKDDRGQNEGEGIPVKRASYEECEFLESSDILDKNGVEIFEGDRVRLEIQGKIFEGIVGPIPDMFRSRGLHPLQSLLELWEIPPDSRDLNWEVIGHRFETLKKDQAYAGSCKKS